MSKLRVIVLGLGGMGSATAEALARRGCDVVGFEQYWRAHNLGSSHGGTRATRKAYVRDPIYLPLVAEAYDLWRRMERDSGAEVFTECGGLVVAPSGSPSIHRSIAAAEVNHVSFEILEPSEVKRRWPEITPPDSSLTFYEPSTAVIRPEKAVLTNIESAIRLGAELHFETIVESWTSVDSGIEVKTSAGVYYADKLVIAGGAWSGDLIRDVNVPIAVGRLLQVWVEPNGGAEKFHIGHHPRWVFEAADGVVAYAFATMPGETAIKMAFSAGIQADIRTFPRNAFLGETDRLIDFMSNLVPSLRGCKASKVAACPYAYALDERFVLDVHPLDENVVIGAGFSSHGFKFVPVVGEILADLAMDGVTKRNIEYFRLSRFVEGGVRDVA